MNPLFLRIAIVHKLPYAVVRKMADDVEQRGRMDFQEINGSSFALDRLIEDVVMAVNADQVRRGIIKDGEQSIVIPARRFNVKT